MSTASSPPGGGQGPMPLTRAWLWGIMVGVAAVIGVVGLVVGLGAAWYLWIQRSGQAEYAQDFSGFKAKPSNTGKFLNERYGRGVDTLELPANSGRYLGADPAGRVIAVNLGYGAAADGAERGTLAGFDAETHSKLYEVDAFECTVVTEDGRVYCSSAEDATIRGYDARTGQQTDTIPAHTSQAGLYYLGHNGETTLLRLERYGESEPSFNHVIGIRDGAITWDAQLADRAACGLISDGETILCQRELTAEQIAQDPEYAGTNTHVVTEITTLDAASGETAIQQRTKGQVFPMSDGWLVQHFLSIAEARSETPPAEFVAYLADGTEIEQRNDISRNALEPYMWNVTGGDYGCVTYPYQAFSTVRTKVTAIVNAEGNVVYQKTYSLFEGQSPDAYAPAGTTDIAFEVGNNEGNIYAISETGRLVLFSMYNHEHPGSRQYRLYDVATQQNILELTGQRITNTYIRDGWLAVWIEGDQPAKQGKLVVYLPAV